jgi:HPt (histidine-containing phosphotransfer) domain-containing protein
MMSPNRWQSRVLDQHLFDALSASLVPTPANTAVMLLDCDLRIRGVNASYEMLSVRRGGALVGESGFGVFPDERWDPEASGTSQLAASVESALRRRATDSMPIVRYDICDPKNPDVYLPKVWTCDNLAVDDGGEQIGVLHRVAEITSLDEAVSALSAHVAGDDKLDAGEQLHALAGLAATIRAEQLRARAMAVEIEQLRCAIQTRDIIGQAKGILMERFDLDPDAAFRLLAKLSQQSNTPLARLARKLVDVEHPGRPETS